MVSRRFLFAFMCGIILCTAFAHASEGDERYLHEWNALITTVMIKDGFSPPLASRTYAYPNIAAYEALVHSSTTLSSLAGQLNGLEMLPQPSGSVQYNWTVAAVTAFATVAKQLVYREDDCNKLLQEHYAQLRAAEIDPQLFQRSEEYGTAIAQAILQWAAKDNYSKTKAMPRYIFSNKEGRWKPTPTDFRGALEPHWNSLRPFTLDSAGQFPCKGPVPYSTDTTSEYYKSLMEVYNAVQNLTDDQREFVMFWDDNPDQVFMDGHVGTPRRHRTPTAHWVGITGEVVRMHNLPIMEAAETYTLVAIALSDAFISCWYEKYKHNYIRPVTYINKYMDPAWLPPLVTPPFPEYTSGHSAISASAATALSYLFGSNVAFTDSTGIPFGFKPRSFPSFHDAAYEAGVSRFYGGIHYMFSITDGNEEGKQVGAHVVKIARTRKKK